MTTTPTIWKAQFTANFGSMAGTQITPNVIGLANGNFLVVWEDRAGGPSPFIDMMGQIFGPNGDTVGQAFHVNSAVVDGDETGSKIVALPDGGYVVAYGAYDAENGGYIVVERFNSSGISVSNRWITDPRSSLTDWEITADNNGNYIVLFERLNEYVRYGPLGGEERYLSRDVQGIIFDHVSNNPRPEFDAGQNGGWTDYIGGDVAAFTNGNAVTVSTRRYNEDTADDLWAEVVFQITQTGTGTTVAPATRIAGGEDSYAAGSDVAVLTGGQFVVVYEYLESRRDVALRIVSGDQPGSTVGPEIVVASRTPALNYQPRVVALNDGGFFVAWANSRQDALLGTRYTASGAVVGDANFVIATGLSGSAYGLSDGTLGSLKLTSDGRILVTFRNSSGEISAAILDPRDNTIVGTAAGEVLTTQVDGTTLLGVGGNDRLLGQSGDDTIYGGEDNDILNGGLGVDTLYGGPGNDVYILRDAREVSVQPLRFSYDDVVETDDGGFDTIIVRRVGIVAGAGLASNVENGIIEGTENFNLGGNELNNRLTGNSAANRLIGNDGNDVLVGLDGDDSLEGGNGIDRASYVSAGAAVVVSLALTGSQNTGGAGSDRLTLVEDIWGSLFNDILLGNGEPNALTGDAGNDIIRGRAGIDRLFGLTGNDVLEGGADNDIVNGGVGIDRASYDSAGAAVTVNLALTGAQDTGGAGSDTLASIENLWGSDFGDTLIGNVRANALIGAGGGDRLRGGNGTDTLTGGAGEDIFVFLALGDSDGAQLDRITDLAAEDVVDLFAIDANGAGPGNGRFVRIDGGAVFTAPGQLRLSTSDGLTTRLDLNTDTDTAAEATILLTGNHLAATAEDNWLL